MNCVLIGIALLGVMAHFSIGEVVFSYLGIYLGIIFLAWGVFTGYLYALGYNKKPYSKVFHKIFAALFIVAFTIVGVLCFIGFLLSGRFLGFAFVSVGILYLIVGLFGKAYRKYGKKLAQE